MSTLSRSEPWWLQISPVCYIFNWQPWGDCEKLWYIIFSKDEPLIRENLMMCLIQYVCNRKFFHSLAGWNRHKIKDKRATHRCLYMKMLNRGRSKPRFEWRHLRNTGEQEQPSRTNIVTEQTQLPSVAAFDNDKDVKTYSIIQHKTCEHHKTQIKTTN